MIYKALRDAQIQSVSRSGAVSRTGPILYSTLVVPSCKQLVALETVSDLYTSATNESEPECLTLNLMVSESEVSKVAIVSMTL